MPTPRLALTSMTVPGAVPSTRPLLTSDADALASAGELATLLDEEFSALRQQDLDHLEQLQPRKTDLLEALADWAGRAAPGGEAAAGPVPASWPDFLDRVRQCRDAHWRNQTLMSRQLDAVRGALKALHVADPTSSVELYDRLGQLSRRSAARGFSDA